MLDDVSSSLTSLPFYSFEDTKESRNCFFSGLALIILDKSAAHQWSEAGTFLDVSMISARHPVE